MQAEALLEKISAAFNALADAGVSLFQDQYPAHAPARLSQACLKFSSAEAYKEHVAGARALGIVTHTVFGGREVSWCSLAQPLRRGGLTLAWLEMIEPKDESNSFDGVVNLGYAVEGLQGVIKIPSADERIVYRYQVNDAAAMSGRK